MHFTSHLMDTRLREFRANNFNKQSVPLLEPLSYETKLNASLTKTLYLCSSDSCDGGRSNDPMKTD